MPVALGRVNSALKASVIPPENIDKLSKSELMEYLELTPKQLRGLDKDALKDLMEVRVEAAAEAPKDKDAELNTISWRYLLRPFQ